MPIFWHPKQELKDAVEYGMHALCLDEMPGRLIIEKQFDKTDRLGDSYFDGIDDYSIRLWQDDPATVFHELTHIMQYANYELEVYDEGHGYWKGETVEGLSYEESPWEIEAHHIEQVLLKCFEAFNEKSS